MVDVLVGKFNFDFLFYVVGKSESGIGIFKVVVYNLIELILVLLKFDGFNEGVVVNLMVFIGLEDLYGYNDFFIGINVVKEKIIFIKVGKGGKFIFILLGLSVVVLEMVDVVKGGKGKGKGKGKGN